MTVPGLPEHYNAVVPCIAEGRVSFFLGAGVNRDAGESWEPGCGRLPLGGELARYFEQLVGRPGTDGLARAAQLLEYELGRSEVNLRTHEELSGLTPPKSAITFLTTLRSRLQAAKEAGVKRRINGACPLIVTTNYDTVLERALVQQNEPFDIVTYRHGDDGTGGFVHHVAGERDPRPIPRPNEYIDAAPGDRTVVVKLHGSIAPRYEDAELVITEDDYIGFLASDDAAGILPVSVAAKIKSTHLLFLGYGLNDWNLRVILRRMWGARQLGFKSWAIQLEPSYEDVKQWDARGVDIKGVDLKEYIGGLDARLAEYLGEQPPGAREEGAAA